MNPRSSITSEQCAAAVDLFEAGRGFRAASSLLGVGRRALRVPFERWKLHGRRALVEKRTKEWFPFEVKREVVRRRLAGETAMDLCSE
ncbi:hypothetical protein [Nocardiopsis sp. ATB16-24]|uniref:hypothetical protein n=1 Tax=Nocardiopsis sp. ATB16-24 TaxID=3019555 RepID=UPI0025577EEC|nr:hypothetical protein [Nocardiopsis sp. ATB16-24]